MASEDKDDNQNQGNNSRQEEQTGLNYEEKDERLKKN